MNYLLLTITIITFLSCNGQDIAKSQLNKEDTIMIQRLDIEYIKKNAQQEEIEIISDDYYKTIHYELNEKKENYQSKIVGNTIDGFTSYKIYDALNYIEIEKYSGDGILLELVKKSKYGYPISEKKLNTNGAVIQNLNYDENYNYPIDKVLEFLQSKQAAIKPSNFEVKQNSELPTPTINRGPRNELNLTEPIPENTNFVWILNNIPSEYNRKKGIYTYILDGNTGELLIVTQFTGKGPNPKYPKSGTIGLYETIYERK